MSGIGATALLVLVGAGTAYQLATAVAAGRRPAAAAAAATEPAVTILKPLYGAEPRLAENVATFLAQDYDGPVQLVCGVQDAADPAIAATAGLPLDLVVDAAWHGSNAKVSNLVNMMAAAKHDVLVLSDSDMVVGPGYLREVVATLGEPGVGAVTCFYTGRGDGGLWSRLAALAIETGFLPSGLLASRLGLAQPCMGSTIALTRDTLVRVGGFARFADVLADDHALGGAVVALGLRVAVAPSILVHACTEASLGELAAHELRWNVTVFRISPWGFAGLGLLNPVPVALLAVLAAPVPGAVALLLALAARLVVATKIVPRPRAARLWWLPLRDVLSFGLFLATFFRQSVDWRGTRLRVTRGGRVTDKGI